MSESEIQSQSESQQETQGLSKMDLRALREAGAIVFRHFDGRGEIEAIQALRNPTPWETEKRYSVKVESAIHSYKDAKFSKAFEHLGSAKFTPTWTTIAALLRAGDVLSLRWEADAWTSENLSNGGLHGDVLYLIVRRGKTRLTFYVGHSNCPDNTARMVQH